MTDELLASIGVRIKILTDYTKELNETVKKLSEFIIKNEKEKREAKIEEAHHYFK